ncbi:hypothetical protein TIFTF001_031550 [Ficus carica]|uniref:Uncharacterized protein n=1 Tax=Ficus carica TaxID=3494 RepID=A0AA88DVG3_FICCA|nr:hypothetical protein TIFTF001_031550 [Ficus carica]
MGWWPARPGVGWGAGGVVAGIGGSPATEKIGMGREFPGSKQVTDTSSKFGPILVSGPVFFVFEKSSTNIINVTKEEKEVKTTEEEETTPKTTTTEESKALATSKEKEIVVEEEKKK